MKSLDPGNDAESFPFISNLISDNVPLAIVILNSKFLTVTEESEKEPKALTSAVDSPNGFKRNASLNAFKTLTAPAVSAPTA